jgi:lipoate-protein ligase B
MKALTVVVAGTVGYGPALEWQNELYRRRVAGEAQDVMLLLEHPHVYTLGRRFSAEHLLLSPEALAQRGIEVFECDRGGSITYHGPGQLVGYPIMRVAGVPGYILTMERAIVAALGRAGIEATTKLGHRHVGVWVGERKIASVGVHLSHGVSSHGFAVNVDNDLDPFTWVVACGLPDVQMTSMAAEGASEGVACFRKRMGHAFCEAFGLRQRLVTPARLGIDELVAA